MVQFSPRGKAATAAVSVSSGQPARPNGFSALAMLALLAIMGIQNLLEIRSGALTGAGNGSQGLHPGFGLFSLCLYSGIGVLCIWQYWRGRNWARMLVLLWSLATAIRALSFLAEHNLDPAALMGRPLNFFQAGLAVVLLYWLNTPAVRAWYRHTSAGAGDLIGDRLRGRLCTGLDFHAADAHSAAAYSSESWRLSFEHDAELILRGPWRIVLDDNLAFISAPADGSSALSVASTDDELPPGSVPAPSHSPEEARRLLQNLRVTSVRVGGPHPPRGWVNGGNSSDLFVTFEMGIELQTWSANAPAAGGAAIPASSPAISAQWKYSDPGLTVIADEAGVQARHRAAPAEAAGAWK